MAINENVDLNLITNFKLKRLLKHDQAGRRAALLGSIQNESAVLLLQRAAFPTSHENLNAVLASITRAHELGSNDLYHWFLANTGEQTNVSDLKLDLFYPATNKHIQKYSAQRLHIIQEGPELYLRHIRPFMEKNRASDRLQWMHNILSGKAEADNIIYRTPPDAQNDSAFVVLPDLNWDRTMLENLHLLALIANKNIWTLRDLKKKHIPWLRQMRSSIIEATRKAYPQLEDDQLKLYVHYLPTYFQFHVHIVHVSLDSVSTQAVGKAIGYESIISQLEVMAGDDEAGMESATLTYTIGEADELWKTVLQPLRSKNELRS